MLQNNDVSEDIYIDANDFLIYYNVYRFKWIMIYFVLFTTVYLVIFTILFIRDTVVKPIEKLTDLITKPDKHSEDTQRKFIQMVKGIEMKKKHKHHKI